jgi:tight adherence protein B
MRQRRRVAGVLLASVAALVVTVSAAPAWAAAEASIDHVHTDDSGTVEMLFGVTGLPDGVEPDLRSVTVELDGEPVGRVHAEPTGSNNIERTTMLALDTSASMSRGDRFAAATQAARSFLAEAPSDVEIGLLTFDSDVEVVAEPTADHDSIAAKLDSLELDETRGTRLYDGIAEAVGATGTDGARSVLVLSDGADVSRSDIGTAIDAAESSGVKVDAVALQQSAANEAKLGEITGASGGSVIPADDPEALEELFTAEAEALSQQILVRFEKPDGVGDEASLKASVVAGGDTYTDTAFVNLAAPEAAESGTVSTPAPLIGERGLWLGAFALAAGLAGLLAVVLIGRDSGPARATQRQLALYTITGQAGTARAVADNDPARMSARDSAVALAQSVVAKADVETTLSQRLTAAGLSVTAAEWLLLHTGIAIMSAVVGFVLIGPPGLVLLLAAGGVIPWLYLGYRRGKRLSAFHAQVADTLQLIAGALSAGLSLPQAVDTAVREGSDPMAGELRRALVEQRLGVGIEDALDGVAQRMTSEDFGWVVMAIRIQREVGGNLAELLTTVAATIREREYLRRQVKVLTAEGRFSAWILGLLPVAMVIYLMLARPDYLRPMYTEPLGILMSLAGVVLLGVGAWSLAKLVRVEA